MYQDNSYLLAGNRDSEALRKRDLRSKMDSLQQEMNLLKSQNELLVKNSMELMQRLQQCEEKETVIRNDLKKKEKENRAMARELLKVKWKEMDRKAAEKESPEDILECLICGNRKKRKKLQIMTAECIFNGGKLERYVCDCCGAIFGPTKFSDLSQTEKDEDYYIHYLGFSEGDSTEKELRAFHMLQPKKNGIYLNYGCGNWSKSLQILREEGYNVYGFEPYADTGGEVPYMISDRSVLNRMRFDGIYSNDVIEHFVNPVEEFKYMKTLLRDSESKMSHSTACYIYKHEITRFHTYFFTGEALKYLCERTGLESCDYVNDEKDFICHVFQTKDFGTDCLPLMYVMGEATRRQEEIVLKERSLIFGPYLHCSVGKIRFVVELECSATEKISARITGDSGRRILQEYKLVHGKNTIECMLSQEEKELELVINAPETEKLIIKQIMQR